MMVIDLSLFSDPKIIWVLRQDFSDPLRMQIGTIFADLSTQTVPLLCPRRTWPWKTKLRFADAIASEDPGPSTSGAFHDWESKCGLFKWDRKHESSQDLFVKPLQPTWRWRRWQQCRRRRRLTRTWHPRPTLRPCRRRSCHLRPEHKLFYRVMRFNKHRFMFFGLRPTGEMLGELFSLKTS